VYKYAVIDRLNRLVKLDTNDLSEAYARLRDLNNAPVEYLGGRVVSDRFVIIDRSDENSSKMIISPNQVDL